MTSSTTLGGARPAHPLRRTAIAAAALAAALGSSPVLASEIDTGNPDLTLRWDNTARLNYAVRVEQRDDKIGTSPIADEGTWSFDRGDAVARRIDLLSEFDVIYRKRFGGRVSAAAWYDGAYSGQGRSNPNAPLVNIPSYANHQYSALTRRLYRGGSGEFLDAFVFGGVDVGEIPVQAKLGRHSVYWGESLLLGGNLHSIAYAQNALDLQKGFATPGTEAKELFRPLNQLSAQAQVSDTLSVAAQYLLEWGSFRYPEGGTYLGPVDFVFNGPDRQRFRGSLPRQRNDGDLAERLHDVAARPGLRQPHLQDDVLKETSLNTSRHLIVTLVAVSAALSAARPSRRRKPRPSAPLSRPRTHYLQASQRLRAVRERAGRTR